MQTRFASDDIRSIRIQSFRKIWCAEVWIDVRKGGVIYPMRGGSAI
jgi:hypothetical protein